MFFIYFVYDLPTHIIIVLMPYSTILRIPKHIKNRGLIEEIIGYY